MRASILAFLFSLAVCSATCLADGKIFRRSAEPAPMPDQAAILTWVDGVQTLVIQTRFDSRSQSDAAWVVPAPSVPEVFAVEPGIVESARAQFNARVDRSPWLVHPALVVIGLCAVAALQLFANAKGGKAAKLTALLAFFCVLFLALDISLGRARSLHPGASSGVNVLTSERIGSYDVAVIASPDASALRDWLEDFGVSLTDAETSVIDAYAKEGWCFVASKLRTTSEKLAAPHPLGLKFEAASPVYPMRLTGVGNQASDSAVPLDLELLVYGNGTASVPGMKVVSSGPLEFETEKTTWHVDDRIRLAHDGVKPLVEGATWGTKLAGSFTPAAMREDLRLGFTPSAIVGRTVVDRADRPAMIAVACGLAVAVAGSLTVPLTSKRSWTGGRFTFVACATIALAIVLTLVSITPKMFVRTERGRLFGRENASDVAWMAVLEAAPSSAEEAKRLFRREWESYTEGEREFPGFGEGPNEYSIAERDGELVLRRIDANGRQLFADFTIALNRPGTTRNERLSSPRVTTVMDEASKIEALLVTLERSDAKFIRSETEYDGRRAAEHLRTKLRSVDRAITAKRFIDEIASASSLTGKPYQVREADGTTVASGDWFRKQLERIEAGK